MSKYPRKIRLTVSIHNSDELESLPIELNSEKDENEWANILRKPKELSYLAIMQAGVLGTVDSVYINPNFITHIRVTDVQE